MALADRGPSVKYTRGPRCLVGVFLQQLSEEDRATLNGWLADSNASLVGIWRALIAEGLEPPNKEVFGRHRRGDCACDRRTG